MGAKPPPIKGRLGAKPPSLEIPNSVTVSVMFFVVFRAFHHLFTPPNTQNPVFPNRSRLDYWGRGRGF